MDSMTLNQYLKFVDSNPKVKNTYNPRFMKIRNDIKSTWYTVKDTNNVVILIQIPSEKAKHVHYSVILEFPMGTLNQTAKTLMNAEMKVFSNCPSFTFMNAKYFEEKGFLVSWAKSLYDPKVFEDTVEVEDSKKEAKTQETVKEVKCEKSLYFAAMHLHQMSPITILSNLSKSIKINNTASVLRHIKSSEDALSKRLKNAKKFPIKKKSETTSSKHSGKSIVKSVKTTSMVKKISGEKKVSKLKHI